MGDVADMQKDIGLDHVFQGGAESRHEHCRQIGDEADGIRQDGLLAVRKIDGAGGRDRGSQTACSRPGRRPRSCG